LIFIYNISIPEHPLIPDVALAVIINTLSLFNALAEFALIIDTPVLHVNFADPIIQPVNESTNVKNDPCCAIQRALSVVLAPGKLALVLQDSILKMHFSIPRENLSIKLTKKKKAYTTVKITFIINDSIF
jgi:hypothetical protein